MLKLFIFLVLFRQSIQFSILKSNAKLNDKINQFSSLKAGKKEISPAFFNLFNFFHQEPDFDFNAQQMIEYRGFKYEAHQVVTEDCYILGMFFLVYQR